MLRINNYNLGSSEYTLVDNFHTNESRLFTKLERDPNKVTSQKYLYAEITVRSFFFF